MALKKQQGFTIVELMIAVSVFSIALLIATTGAVTVGRMYQQGATRAKLLTAAREIQAQFSQEIQYSGSKPTTGSIGSYNAMCIGNVRYRWKLTTPSTPNQNEFYKDTFNNLADCSAAGSPSNTEQPLPVGTAVSEFNMPDPVGGLYKLRIHFAIGSQDMFEGDDYNGICRSNVLGGEYCAVVELNNEVARKVIN